MIDADTAYALECYRCTRDIGAVSPEWDQMLAFFRECHVGVDVVYAEQLDWELARLRGDTGYDGHSLIKK